jgi:dolichol-phosphate mannosyltransferase
MNNKNTLIIPAYNESSRLFSFLTTLSPLPADILLICDGNDDTALLAEAFIKNHPNQNIRCLSYPHRLGKGGAVIEGFKNAHTERVGYVDADGSVTCTQLQILFPKLDECDAVIGSRWIEGSVIHHHQSLTRRFMSRVFNECTHFILGLQFKDTQCGAKVFRKTAINAVLPFVHSKGFEFDADLLYNLIIREYMVTEYPIEWNDVDESKVRITDAFGMLYGLLKVRLSARGTS